MSKPNARIWATSLPLPGAVDTHWPVEASTSQTGNSSSREESAGQVPS